MEEKEEYALNIIFAYLRNKKSGVKAIGDTLNLLTLFVAISKSLAERISKEKNINMEEAEKFIIECVSDGIQTIKD